MSVRMIVTPSAFVETVPNALVMRVRIFVFLVITAKPQTEPERTFPMPEL